MGVKKLEEKLSSDRMFPAAFLRLRTPDTARLQIFRPFKSSDLL